MASLVPRPASSAEMQAFSHGMRNRLTMNPGRSLVTTLVLPSECKKSTVALCAQPGGVAAIGDLDQLHERRRVAVVGADDALGQPGAGRDAGDGERRGVGVEQRRRRDDVVETREGLLLQREVLEDRLDHDVARREVGEVGRADQRVLRTRAVRGVDLAEADALVEERTDGVGAALEVRLVRRRTGWSGARRVP